VTDESRVLVVEDGRSDGARRRWAADFVAASINADRWDFRSLGSTLALAYLAAGRISAYVLFWGAGLHTAAGALILSEAGGSISDLHGAPWTVESDSMVASASPQTHQDLLALLQGSAKR
jgi:fructose-1,6-bisphosphatase/inositol monophosphatase family enzyme